MKRNHLLELLRIHSVTGKQRGKRNLDLYPKQSGIVPLCAICAKVGFELQHAKTVY